MADFYRIYNRYKQDGFLEVPGYYDKGRDNHCKVCGWENENGRARSCSACFSQQVTDGKAGKKIHGLSVMEMSQEDYIIFRAIAARANTDNAETVNAMIEEYADEVKARNAQRIREYQAMAQARQAQDSVLYDD